MKEKYYVAYGSNLNLEQMKHRCPTATMVGASEIKDYELVFRGSKTGAYATIEPMVGGIVPVLVWDIKERDEKNLDRYEGYPDFYQKEILELEVNGASLSTMVYVMPSHHALGNPRDNYIDCIMEGYKTAKFDTEILYSAIEKTQERMELEPPIFEMKGR